MRESGGRFDQGFIHKKTAKKTDKRTHGRSHEANKSNKRNQKKGKKKGRRLEKAGWRGRGGGERESCTWFTSTHGVVHLGRGSSGRQLVVVGDGDGDVECDG